MLYSDHSFLIKNANIVCETETIKKASVLVEEGIITAIGKDISKTPKAIRTIDANNNFVGPGLIDMHIHGCGGFDTASVTETDSSTSCKHMQSNISKMRDFLCSNGITSFQLAIVPHLKTLSDIEAAYKLSESESWKNSFVGVYTEGPYINEKKKGGISKESILPYSKQSLDNYLAFTKDTANRLISCMTIAPEMLPNDELYTILRQNNIKAAWGHSNAFAENTPRIQGMHITHLFNAMTPLDHKSMGLAGVPFIKDFSDATFELICDTVHVCPQMLELIFTTLGPKNLCLISDAMSHAGLPAGEFQYMGKTAINDGTCCRYKDDGLLIGSSLLINKTGQMLFEKDLININDFFQIASTNPARVLSLQDRGTVEIGKKSDLIIVDKSLNIVDVFTI